MFFIDSGSWLLRPSISLSVSFCSFEDSGLAIGEKERDWYERYTEKYRFDIQYLAISHDTRSR
jgi:hypothetical protein